MRRLILSTLVVTAGLAGPAATLAEGAPSRQNAHTPFTSQAPGKATGLDFSAVYKNPDDPAAKPYAVSQVVTTLAKGASINTQARPRCTATDVELMVLGKDACPAKTVVGGGLITLDTGFPAPRLIRNDVTLFNAPGELIFLLETNNQEVPQKFVSRATVEGRTTNAEVPPVPGAPPPDPFTAIKRARVTIGPAGRYMVTPDNCPPDGTWTNRVAFSYRDGVRQVDVTDSPCTG